MKWTGRRARRVAALEARVAELAAELKRQNDQMAAAKTGEKAALDMLSGVITRRIGSDFTRRCR